MRALGARVPAEEAVRPCRASGQRLGPASVETADSTRSTGWLALERVRVEPRIASGRSIDRKLGQGRQ